MKNILAYSLPLFFSLLISVPSLGQEEDKKILKALKGDQIEWIGDGVFKVKKKKSQKWGMFQKFYGDPIDSMTSMIPMQYDSIHFYGFNEPFMPVCNEGKVGVFLSALTYHKNARQTVPCLYNKYMIKGFYMGGNVYPRVRKYLAVAKEDKWAWIDWLTGEPKTEFIYSSPDNLPAPDYEQKISLEK